MAKKRDQGVREADLASYEQQCAALAKDWQRLRALIEAYHAPDADRERLEMEYLAIRSALSCDYPVLSYWRKGGYGLTAGINRMMAGSPALRALAESARASEGRVNQTWNAVWASLGQVSAALRDARAALEAGKEVRLPAELLQHDTHVPFPVKKVLSGLGIAMALVLAAGSLYFLRHFVGVWAPGAGAGIVVSAGMTDEEQIEAVLGTMAHAFEQNSVDQFMTVIADDFVDEDGNGKRALRMALQAYKESGDFAQVAMDWSRVQITERGELLDVRPVYIITPDERIAIHLGFKPYRGKLLIATGSSA